MTLQLSLIPNLDSIATKPTSPIHDIFSHDAVCDETERKALEQKYAAILQETHKFNRQIVSFQANKIEKLHNWIKYREGFSAELVELLLSEFHISEGQAVLDPFAGSCTTLLEAKLKGINAVGIELLPHCHLAWQAKSKAFEYNVDELVVIYNLLKTETPPDTGQYFPHLTITEGAFAEETEKTIVNYLLWFDTLTISENTKILCRAILMSILEAVSYTRKDGQYLRWDSRSTKILQRNEMRIQQGKKAVIGIDKGELPEVQNVLCSKLAVVIRDVVELQRQPLPQSEQQLLKGNSLYVLPTLDANQFDVVITSPPYANRYDYTRTYALELAYLKVDSDIFRLRQNMLSCTVENKPKFNELHTFYQSINRESHFHHVMEIIQSAAALSEVNLALRTRNERGEINNNGVLKMVDLYFSELAFIYAELFQVCRSGVYVAFVNDNVRYAGEVIPVDLICTHLAEMVGFVPKTVYVLPQRKGNSSQQMSKFGRRELRKSITIWQKP